MTLDGATELTGGSRLLRNSIFNLIGQAIPLLAALIAIPLLIRGLGMDRFGVLTLAWMVIGYFSLFDLGLGRALTQVVAETLTNGQDTQGPPIVWTAIVMMFVLGLVGTLVVSLISPWLVYSGLTIPGPLQTETLHSFYFLAAAIPLVVITAALVGILSAFQRFGTINAIRVPMGVLGFFAPLAILPYSQDLFMVTAALVVVRLLAFAAFVMACWPLMPPLRSGYEIHHVDLRRLFHFGVWTTVTNVVSPLLVYLDRFIIGGFVSVAAVAYYATPYEVVTKTLILSGAVVGVLFPAFAATYKQDHARLVQLFARGTKYVALMLFPVILLIIAFAQEGLRWWLGEEFALQSSAVLQCLAIGVFVNGLAYVFATLVQGVGRPDLSAKLHLLELPIYLLVLWWAIQNYGILGAAMAWTGRMALDGVLLFWISSRFLGDNRALMTRMAAGMLIALAGLMLPLCTDSIPARATTVMTIMIVFVLVTWVVVLAPDERQSIKARMGWSVRE